MQLPGRSLLVVNVRLALPGFVRKVASPSDSLDLASEHEARVAQFPRLSEETSRIRRLHGGIEAIVCGDFNSPAHARSVRALAPLVDVWPRAGRGWGGTMGDDLPIARIDQCWASDGMHAVQAFVARGRGSDHRMLVVDFGL